MYKFIFILRSLLELITLIGCLLALFQIIPWTYNILIPEVIDIVLFIFVKFINWCKGY